MNLNQLFENTQGVNEGEGVIPDPKYDHEPPAQESDPSSDFYISHEDWQAMNEENVVEGAEIMYAEELAEKVFNQSPNLQNDDDILTRGFQLAKKDPRIGGRVNAIFRTEDFPSDFVSYYRYIQHNHGISSGMNEGNTDEDDDGRDKFYYQRNNIWRVMDGDELVHEYTPDRYEVVGAKKLLARFDDEGYDVTHVISPMGTVTYLYGKPMHEGFDGEYDDEAGMAQGNLHTIARAAQGLLDTIDDQENLPEWVQEKIAKVEGMMVSAWDYLQSQEEQGIDPRQDLDEIGDTPKGREKLEKYMDKAEVQVSQHWADVHNKSHLPTDKKMAKRNAGSVAASNRLGGFGIQPSARSRAEKEVAEIIDYDTLNQLGSHPMAAPLAAAGGAAIGGAIGGGIKKTVDYFQKKKEQKAQARRSQQQGVAEEQLSEIGNTPAGRAALGAVQNRAYNKMDAWSANPTSGYSSTPKDVRKATSAGVAAGNRLHGFGPDNSRTNTVMARDALRQKQALRQTQGVAEAGFPGAPDVEMPPMKPSGDPQRDKLKQEYMDLHREIKSLVDIPYSSNASPEQKMQAKARIKQLNDRADQIKAILEPRQPPNEWQKKTYGYDDNWNIVKKGVAEGEEHSPVAGAITRRIMSQRLDLLKKYGPANVAAAIDDVAEFVGDAEEIGSSDVSGWVLQVERALNRMGQGLGEAGGRNYHANTTGFARGTRDPEGQDPASDTRTWYIRLNGKLIKDKQGMPYSFRGKAAANKAAVNMQAKLFNKGKEFVLTTNPNDPQQGVAEQKKNSKASAVTEGSLGDQSLAVLMQARQDLQQKRAAEIAAWEQDFRKNTAPKFAATQSTPPAPVAQPGQGHSELRAQLTMLDTVIKKQQQLDALSVQAKKLELLNEPDVVDDLNTSMYVRDAIRNNRYDYAALNKRLDTVIPRVSNRITQRQAAWKKPRAMSEDAGSVEAWGYAYNRRDQRVMWRKTFAGEAAAQAWADQHNATILGMRPVQQGVAEEWSQKYKSSINCSHPKGFSQKAHCAGKRKHNESVEIEMTCPDCGMCETHGDNSKDQLDELKCWPNHHRVAGTKAGSPGSCKKNKTNEEQHSESCPHCGGEMVSEELMNEKQDACYYKVKSRYKVWPSAYASGALVQCRKKGAKNWGNKSESAIGQAVDQVDENLRDWFGKDKWVRFGPDGKIRGDCARGDDSEGKPKCLPRSKANALGKKGRASAASRKRRQDPNPERSGPAINVNTKKKSNEDMTNGSDKKEATFRIQKMLNKKFGANLDVDGIMGPLTLQSINKFMPDAAAGLADQPNRTTAVQGKKIKEESRGRRVTRSGPNETAVKEQN